ncbi:hypothetical protein PYW08_008454 [Mythimna loreyi]|uniref:Uncharacterized protein n=1 Tax=Mythimna loreyi TaxID=667449 RepID=A0ACC2QE03_9NEOP|nr:hypothetical protein PYW08_008454 [Mythimna loreyi]
MIPIGIKLALNRYCQDNSGYCLKDKVVIVTGAGAGIGASTAYAFAKEGAKVVVADIIEDNVKKVTKRCEEELCAKSLGVHCDVSVDEQCKSLISDTVSKFGTIDVLVNNAGILTFGTLLNADIMEPYDKTLGINLRACVYLTMLATPYLVQTKGNVVNISSILGCTYSGNSKYMPYCISKAGLDHFMFGAALELSPCGVRVNNVCPGPVKTEIFSKAGVTGSWKEIGESFKLTDMSEPEEIADLIVYLASYKARSITGVRYYIDRGHLLMG